MIVQGAISFFAEHGFEGQTRELAKRLGITQPLLYRYFPDKAALIDRVYHEVFVDRSSSQWLEWIGDQSRPLRERLTCFYQDYARVVLSYEWVRLYVFSGLKGLDVAKRYAEAVFSQVYPAVIEAVRSAEGGRPLTDAPMTDAEVEHLWALHGAIFYLGVRRWVYRLPVPDDQNAAVAARVAAFLDGAAAAMRNVAGPTDAQSRVPPVMPQLRKTETVSSIVDVLSRR